MFGDLFQMLYQRRLVEAYESFYLICYVLNQTEKEIKADADWYLALAAPCDSKGTLQLPCNLQLIRLKESATLVRRSRSWRRGSNALSEGRSMSIDAQNCPHCGEPCDRESVDVGVGVIFGPWGCSGCGWSSDSRYDSREGIVRDGDDRVLDQFGVSHHVDRLAGKAVLVGLNVDERGKKT